MYFFSFFGYLEWFLGGKLIENISDDFHFTRTLFIGIFWLGYQKMVKIANFEILGCFFGKY